MVPSEPPVTEQLGSFAARKFFEGVASELLEDARHRLLDFVGNAIGGSAEPIAEVLRRASVDTQSAEFTAIGSTSGMALLEAAYWNGCVAHALDYDDTHMESVSHPTSVVAAAAIAAGEHMEASGEALMRAIAIGNEVAVRVGLSAVSAEGESAFFDRGFHPTSVAGCFGAATAAALLLRLGEEDVAHAIGVTASFASGILEANRSGGSVKQVHAGHAAVNGLRAAFLARAGLTAPKTAFEGRFGFLRAFGREGSEHGKLLEGLGTTWFGPATAFKVYPANIFVHNVIDVALEIRTKGVDPSRVASVRLGLPRDALRSVAEPRDIKIAPESGYAAKFSAPFVFASTLLGSGKPPTHEDFTDERVRDPAVRALAALVNCYPDEKFDDLWPHHFGCQVTLVLHDGTEVRSTAFQTRGTKELPMTPHERQAKFVINAIHRFPYANDGEAELLYDQVAQIGSSSVIDVGRQISQFARRHARSVGSQP